MEVQDSGQTLFVTTDLSGTPEFVFDDKGQLVNRFMRSPYGALISEVGILDLLMENYIYLGGNYKDSGLEGHLQKVVEVVGTKNVWRSSTYIL